MKNKSRKIIFWTLAILAFSLGLPAEAADTHTHFDAEKVKPGVGFFESYRSQAAIERDWYGPYTGALNDGWYNLSKAPYIDGAVIPIVPELGLGQIRNSFSTMNGKSDIWIQYEIWIDQDFVSDGPFSTWESMKLFRVADLTKSTCPVNQILETMNITTAADHIGTHGGYCGSSEQDLHTPKGNTWDRITWRFWFAGKRMQMWSTNIATGVTVQVMDQPISYPSTGSITGAWPLLHSTSRGHHGSGDQTETYHIGYRNIIVSTQPISFGSGSSTPACSSNADCSDGNLCNGTETCSSGTCLSGTPVKIDDGVGCTTDSCNPTTGQVTHSPNNTLCADTSPCTTNERCDAVQGCLKTTISQCTGSDGCCPTGCTAANDSDCASTGGGDLYVAKNGSDSNTGTISSPLLTIAAALSKAPSGSSVIVRAGTYTESISFPRQSVILKEMDGENAIISRSGGVMSINQPNITVEGFTIDGNWGAQDTVTVGSNGDNAVLKNLEIKNSMRDCVDMSSPTNVLIEGSKIHDCIWFDAGVRNDSHGVVTTGINGLTIRNSEIYYVSGDAIQIARDETGNGWDNVLLEDSTLWNGKLPSARGGAPSGANPGEDGIDTKQYGTHTRGRLTVKNVTVYGWDGDYVSNGAAFNMKENITVDFDGITCRDSEICFRLRGPGVNGGALATVKNAVMYNSNKGVRYEDGIVNLHVYNSTFGGGLNSFIESAGGHGTGFEIKNNLFLGTKPSDAGDSSNLSAAAGSFNNASTNDYHLVSSSPAIDAGQTIAVVTIDRDKKARPSGSHYDVGAYEFGGTASSGTPGDLNSDGKVDIFDYSLFISDFGKTGTGLAADLNSDGKVDIFDYSIFISNFGK